RGVSFLMPRRPPTSLLFPYTTLFRSQQRLQIAARDAEIAGDALRRQVRVRIVRLDPPQDLAGKLAAMAAGRGLVEAGRQRQQRADRKSTRLNSSHVKISYAVFCLKKK